MVLDESFEFVPAQSPNASGGTAVDDEKLNQKSFTELVSPCRSFHSSRNRYTAHGAASPLW